MAGFLQQLVCYLGDGYLFYRSGWLPKGSELSDIDKMLVSQYGIGASAFSRAKRKEMGISSMHYLRQA